MIIVQILLILLVAAPVLGLAFYLWFILEENVRKRNLHDKANEPSSGRRKRR